MNKINLVLVDDHHILLDGLSALLKTQKDMLVTATYTDSATLLSNLDNVRADVFIVDINMPGMNGIELTRVLKTQYDGAAIICLSMHDDAEHITEMAGAGAAGYLLKNTNDKDLLEAIRTVAVGRLYFPDDILAKMQDYEKRTSRMAEEASTIKLTARELEILKLIAAEYSNARIAESLFISERTVETHRKNMLRKTNHSTMLGLLKFAIDHKLL
jgi:DNA-binding NarL/FixJ family response regulator